LSNLMRAIVGVSVIVAVLYGVVPLQAQAQEQDQVQQAKPAFPIGIVDMGRVHKLSTALRSIADQVTEYRNAFQRDIQAEENSLREANQALSRQHSVLNAEAFDQARRTFEDRVADVQRTVQQRKAELEKVREASMRELRQAMNIVIAEIAEERGLILVLPRGQTVLSAKSLEITEEVSKRLNEQLPDITVAKPGQ